jgi:hypothetical protein
LPDVEEVLPEATGCRLSVGEPLGVNVASVTSGGAASGILQEGDIISSIDGVATPTRPELTEALAGYSPDDTVEIEFTRDGTASTASITLGAHPDDETRAMIGITVQTAFEQVEPDSADDVVGPSATARAIQIGESLFLFDPLDNTWQDTGITPPTETRWVSTSSGIYSVTDTDPVAVLDLFSGEALEDDGFRGWVPQRLIGAVGDIVVLVVTTPAQDQPGFVNLAIAGFDPATAETLWVSPISSASGIPVAAYGSPDESAFLVVGADPDSGEQSGVALYDAGGTLRNAPGLGDLGDPIGWFDVRSMAYRTSETVISVFDFVDGTTDTYDLPENIVGSVTASVGDGRHILAVGGRDLLLQDLTDPNVSIPLATNCTLGQTGDPGWGL